MPQKSGGHQGGSVVDILQQVLHLLSEAKLAPDGQAHQKVLDALSQGIIEYIQAVRTQQIGQAINGPQQGGGAPPGGSPGMGGPPGAGGGPPGAGGGPPGGGGGDMGPPPGPQQIAPGGGSGMSGFGTPNPDELKRMLAGPASVGVG